jgi:hypothetical protein
LVNSPSSSLLQRESRVDLEGTRVYQSAASAEAETTCLPCPWAPLQSITAAVSPKHHCCSVRRAHVEPCLLRDRMQHTSGHNPKAMCQAARSIAHAASRAQQTEACRTRSTTRTNEPDGDESSPFTSRSAPPQGRNPTTSQATPAPAGTHEVGLRETDYDTPLATVNSPTSRDYAEARVSHQNVWPKRPVSARTFVHGEPCSIVRETHGLAAHRSPKRPPRMRADSRLHEGNPS